MKVQDKLNGLVTDPSSIEAVEKLAAKASYGASAGTVFFGFTTDEWGVIGIITGIVLGVATFSFNAWFRMKYMRPKDQDSEQCK